MMVKCWDCPASFEVAADMEGHAYKQGEIQRFREGDAESPWCGLCPRCKVLHARADDPSRTIAFRPKAHSLHEVHTETARILLSADELIEFNPELIREEAIHRAVDLHFDPEREANEGFREYLKWRK